MVEGRVTPSKALSLAPLLSSHKEDSQGFLLLLTLNVGYPLSFRGPWRQDNTYQAQAGLNQALGDCAQCMDLQLVSCAFLPIVCFSGKMSQILGLKASTP